MVVGAAAAAAVVRVCVHACERVRACVCARVCARVCGSCRWDRGGGGAGERGETGWCGSYRSSCASARESAAALVFASLLRKPYALLPSCRKERAGVVSLGRERGGRERAHVGVV